MGDRALVIFKDQESVSPIIYLHWSGSEVPYLLSKHAKLMAHRKDDLQYAAARFIGIAHQENDGCTGLGVWNAEEPIVAAVLSNDEEALAKYSHGDAGVVVVDAVDFSWKAYGGYLAGYTPTLTAGVELP